jgi:hypothetical protein
MSLERRPGIQCLSLKRTSNYAAELCTSYTISEILCTQRAQNAGQGNLTDPEEAVTSIIFCGTMATVSHL